MADVLVVGAGVLGLSVAAATAARGARVTVLERRAGLCGGASAASFAWANARGDHPAGYTALKRAALAGHMAGVAGPDPWFRPAPTIDRRSGEARTGDAFPGEGWVDVAAYARAQRRRVEQHGGSVRTGAQVVEVLTDGGVRDAAGAVTRADVVVVAAGTASTGLLGPAGQVPAAVGDATGPRGFLVLARLPGHGLQAVVLADDVQLRPAGPDLLALQSLTVEADLAARGERATRANAWEPVRVLAAAAGVVLPPDAFVAVHESARPQAVDGLPALGRLGPRTYLVLSHSGVTLAPLLSDLVAQELTGHPVADLEPFRPTRPPVAAPGRDRSLRGVQP